jgi:NAD(P)-dependent dehydrogenase (short-subunit alcohol dehydrogenase family)
MSSANVLDCRPSLEGRVALVTGGLGGIGRAVVDSLVAHGARVAFTYAERRESLDAAAELVASVAEQLSAHSLDLRFEASIQACFAEAVERWGVIDILVNNAAVGSATVAAYADGGGEQDSAMLSINADGTLKMCQVYLAWAAQHPTGRAGKIINISSVGGGVAVFPGFRLSDGMSKAAVAFLTRQLAAELTHEPIDVFAVCPGATNTAMFQASTLDPMSPTDRATFIGSMPKRRLIEPGDIAHIVTFLASGYSTPMHGAVIDASMGLGVRPGLMTERPH